MDINELNRKVIEEFRANSGTVTGQFENVPLLLLETTGARSGQTRVKPLAYFNDGDRLIVIASFAGADTSPPWFFNLVNNPDVGVEVGREKFAATASIAEEPERSELYEKMVAINPVFADYQDKTERVIPVVILTRAS